MNLTPQQLAEILAGITRSQQAIIDAMDRANPGWRNTYLLPTLTVAANQRLAEVRLLDLPSRMLLRSQGRNPMDQPTVERNLQEALGLAGGNAAVAAAVPAASAPAPAVAAKAAAPAPTAPAPAPTSAPTPASTPSNAPDSDDLSNFFDS